MRRAKVMASAGPNGSEWLSSIRKILEADTLLKSRYDEDMADTLACDVGFPFTGDANLDVYEFWDGVIEKLKENGYKIVDYVYTDDVDTEIKQRRRLLDHLGEPRRASERKEER